MTNLVEKILNNLPIASKTMHETSKRTLVELQRATLDLAEKFGGVRTQTEAAEKLLKEGKITNWDYNQRKVAFDGQLKKIQGNINQLYSDMKQAKLKNIAE